MRLLAPALALALGLLVVVPPVPLTAELIASPPPTAAGGRLLPPPRTVGPAPQPVVPRRQASRLIIVYASHPAERYADGTTIGAIAATLAAALRQAGFQRVLRLRGGGGRAGRLAYVRSRAWLFPYLWRRPLWLLDVHRDDVAPGTYAGSFRGVPVARVLLVVGDRNAAMRGNLARARRVAAAARALLPGLLRGIYLGPGDYNQDLGPQALLLEIGNRDSPRADAVRAAQLIALAIVAATPR